MEKLRNAFLIELDKLQLEPSVLEKVLAAFDASTIDFEITKKETGLIVQDVFPEIAKVYLAVKHVEGCASGTLYGYKGHLEKFFQKIRVPVNQITPDMIRMYLFKYKEEHDISNRSLNKIRSTLRSFFSWASSESYIDRNPAENIKRIKEEVKQRKSMTREELERLRRACKTSQERAVIDLLYSTACRESELASMKLADLNLDEQCIEILGKGNKYRKVFLNASAKLSLLSYLAERKDDSPFVVVGERFPHDGLTRGGIGYIVKRIAKRAGLPWVSPHILRHTAATLALKSGMPVQDIQKMLGHSNISTTMIYAEVDTTQVQSEHVKYVI